MTRKLNKRVDFVAKDADEQTATGAVLVPDELDRQGDFLRPEDIENLFNDDVDDGVMHARFPDDAAETTHRLLDEPETIGGREFAAGAWIAERKYKNDELWELVDDGILDGFSIGGDIEELNEMPNAEMPDDVAVPDSVSVPAQVTRIRDGIINEVSDVDIPAVPAAVHAEKVAAAKNVVSRADTEEQFIDLMGERGHDEEEARRLWAFLEETKDSVEKPFEGPGGQGPFADFEDCVASVSGDGTTEEEAEAICAEWENQSKQETLDDIDTTPPEAVQQNAQAALDAREETGNPNDCGAPVGWARARDLSNGAELSEDTVNRMVSFLSRHLAQAPDDLSTQPPRQCQRMMIQAWGGREALEWAESVQEEFAEVRENSDSREVKDVTENPEDNDTDSEAQTDKDLDDVDDATLGSRIKSLLLGTDDSADPNEIKGEGEAPGTSSTKVGRTLSKQNENALKASIDAQLEIMENAGIETGITRFTDRTDDEFNLADFGGSEKAAEEGWQKTFKLFSAEQAEIVAGLVEEFVETQGLANVSDFEAWAMEQDSRGNLSADEVVAVQSAIEDFVERRDPDLEDPVVSQFVDFVEFQREVENSKIKEAVNDSDMTEKDDTGNGNDTSTEKDDVFADAPEWAQKLNERIDEVEQAQGETEKDDDGDGDEGENMPEWAKSLEERVDRIANSEADTDQTAKGTDNGEGGDEEGLDAVAKLLG